MCIISSVLPWAVCSKAGSQGGTLIIRVENVASAGGMVWVGLYDSPEDFLVKDRSVLKGIAVKEEGNLVIPLSGIAFGQYALAVFHDKNNNGILDQNLLGIPKEPFAFSRPAPSRWRLPRFREVAFTFEQEGQVLLTRLRPWRKH